MPKDNILSKNVEIGYAADSNRTAHLTEFQQGVLLQFIIETAKKEEPWSAVKPCSTFASDAWKAVTGEKLSPGVPSTPANLKNSIIKANGGQPSGTKSPGS